MTAARPRHALSLRVIMILGVVAAFVYVAAIAIFLTRRISPTAAELREHSEQVLAVHDRIRESLASLNGSVELVRGLVRDAAERRHPAPESVRVATQRVRARLDSVAALQTAGYLQGVPPDVRFALANAAQEESRTGVLLLDALAALELGRTAEAETPLRAAEDARRDTETHLRDAERAALADMVAREHTLGDAAHLAGTAVLWWLVAGVILVPIALILIHSRFYRPMESIERALERVADGDLEVELDVALEDEMGRLKKMFNSMTAVLRRRSAAEKERGQSLQQQLTESQRLDSLGRLAGGVAHDFNNLLTAILGTVELALETPAQGAQVRTYLQEVRRAAERAAELTGQLLAFARRKVIEPRVVDLNRVTRDMDRLFRRVLGAQIELVTRLADNLGATRVDPTQIEAVLLNLVVNARDAMPSGGKLTIETTNVEIDEAYAARHPDAQPGRFVCLSVTDNGVGMTEDIRQRVFEPFFTTKDRTKGTGLGLSTAYGIVKQAGGHIWVYSEPERGATFKVLLPFVSAPVTPDAPEAPPAPPPRGTETILLVEDEPQVREMLAGGLAMLGYRVVTAGDGEDALEQARRQPDLALLITDVVLPVLNGRDLARRLAREQPHLPVLFISGYAEEAVVHQGVVDQGVQFLSKPFTVAELARRVRLALDGTPG